MPTRMPYRLLPAVTSHADYLTAFGSPEVAEHHQELDAFLRRHLD